MKNLLGLVFLVSIFGLSGCISTGDDDDGGSGVSSVSYTGKTEPATLASASETNTLYQEYMSSGTDSLGGPSDFYSSMNTAPTETSSPVVKALSKLDSSRYSLKVAEPFNDSFTGACGGSASINGSYDDATGYLDITLTANNLCETYNGSSTDPNKTYMNGSFRLKGDLNELELTFNAFSFKDLTDGVHVEMGGTMAMGPGTGIWDTQITSNFVAKDYILNKQFKMENYVIVSNYSGFEESGRLYHSDYGYVDVETVETLGSDWNYSYPVDGKIKITGTKTFIIEYLGATYTIGEDTNNDDVGESIVTYNNP